MEFTRDSESPDSFHFWTAVSTVAGALRRRVWIDMRKFQWVPNFYIILVGPPGIAAKSTSVSIGTRLLEKVDGIKFGPQSLTWQALALSLSEAMEYTQYLDVKGNPETIANSSITIHVRELGTFLKIDDGALVDVLVSMWDGQQDTFSHKTVTSGLTEAKNPWLNIIGCTTPSWLESNFPESMIGGGLTSRIIFIYEDTKRELIAYPDEVIRDAEYYDFEKKLVEDLQDIALLAGPYTLHADARVWGHQWYKTLWSSRPLHMASERYSGYLARKQTHVHKLAIILASAKRADMIIFKEDLVEADLLLTSVEPHMLKVFESIGLVDEAKFVAAVVNFVKAYQWITADDLWNRCMNVMEKRDFINALKIGIESGILGKETKNGKLGIIVGAPKGTVH